MKLIKWMIVILVWTGPVWAADSIESIISQEKAALEEWEKRDDDLPPVFLLGTKEMVQLYAPEAHSGKGNGICEPFAMDELVELSRGNSADFSTELNVSYSRVREALEDSCLIRPEDEVVAVGPGWQETRVIKTFVVRRAKPYCSNAYAYSLWGKMDRPLPEGPLFFSTDRALNDIPNQYTPMARLARSTEPYSLKNVVPFSEDYAVTALHISTGNCDRLFWLRRREASLEDDRLANEILLWSKGSTMKEVWSEAIDLKKGSGHIALAGTFDFNADGRLDLWLEGDHAHCPFRILMEGQDLGFRLVFKQVILYP